MTQILQFLARSWLLVTIAALLATSILQYSVIFPLEAAAFPHLSQYASLLFLPHAARVLSTVILGPKAFFALLPAMLVQQHFLYTLTGNSWSAASFIFTIVGALCAPLGYILVKHLSRRWVDHSIAVLNWRYIFLIGIIASAINSTGMAVLLMEIRNVADFAGLMLRFFTGDMLGLLVGLVILTFAFRILRNIEGA